MDLNVVPTLIGQAYPGQKVVIVVEGVEYIFEYQPHDLFDCYTWYLVGQEAETVSSLFPRLGGDWETTYDPSFFKVYLSADQPVALNNPLHLRAVPRGNALSGDRADACLGRVEAIRVL